MDTQNLDKSLTILQSSKDRWAGLPVSDKIGYIDILRKEKNEYVQTLFDNSNFLVKDGVKRFGISDKINNEKYNKYGISLI